MTNEEISDLINAEIAAHTTWAADPNPNTCSSWFLAAHRARLGKEYKKVRDRPVHEQHVRVRDEYPRGRRPRNQIRTRLRWPSSSA